MNESTGYSENILHAKCMKIFGMVTRRLNETSEGEKSRNPFSPSLPNGTRYWLIRRSSPAAVLLRYYAVTQAGSALEKKNQDKHIPGKCVNSKLKWNFHYVRIQNSVEKILMNKQQAVLASRNPIPSP